MYKTNFALCIINLISTNVIRLFEGNYCKKTPLSAYHMYKVKNYPSTKLKRNQGFTVCLWSPAGKGLTSWLLFVVSSVSLSISHWYPGSGVVLDCIDSWSLPPYLLLQFWPGWTFRILFLIESYVIHHPNAMLKATTFFYSLDNRNVVKIISACENQYKPWPMISNNLTFCQV